MTSHNQTLGRLANKVMRIRIWIENNLARTRNETKTFSKRANQWNEGNVKLYTL